MLFHTVYSTLVAHPEISLSKYITSLSNYRTCDTQRIKLKADSSEKGLQTTAREAILLIKK